MLLFQRIEEIAYRHNDVRKVIGEFILYEKSNIRNLSMQEIADKTYTSKSSLVRFAKLMGYKGWKEFIQAFLEESYYETSHYSDIDPNIPFVEGDSHKDIIYKLCNLHVESILDTADQLDQVELDRAIELLIPAQKIALFGQSPNNHLANLFIRKMKSIGRIIMFNESDQGLLAHALNEKDCAILISYSGTTDSRVPNRFIPILKNNHVPIIAITGLGDNFLRNAADCILSMSSREKLYSKIATFATEESIGFILNVIYSCYFSQDYEKNLKYKIKVSSQLEQRHSYNVEIREDDTVDWE